MAGRGRGRGRLQPPPQPPQLETDEPLPPPPPPLGRLVAGRGVGYSSTFFEIDDDANLGGIPSTGPLRPREDATLSSSSDSEEDDFITTFRRLHPTSSAATPTTSSSQSSPLESGSGSGSGSGRATSRPRHAPGMEMLDRYPVVESPLPSSLSSPSSSISIGRASSTEEEWIGGREGAPQPPVVERRGRAGEPVSMCVNFIRLEQIGGNTSGVWEYHVDFPNNPALSSRRLRWGILRRLDHVLGPTLNFDGGSKLFLPFPLPDSGGLTVLTTQHPVIAEDILVEIKFVKKNTLEDSVHFYNILLRQVMEKLGLVEMQRHFYDYEKVFHVPEHKLEIWPGYVTAIEVYEGGLMLNCDSSFRVLRSDTMLRVLEQMFYLQNENDRYDARRRFRDYALGKIVLTKYNNKHYRVDDVDWESNPLSTFPQMKGGNLVQTSFVDYYRSNYNVEITDLYQPLLVTRGKVRRQEIHGMRHAPDNILLVPELCFVTGMTEEITSDFKIMKVVADKTRIPPIQRYHNLQTFIKSVNDRPEVRVIFEKWGLRLADGLVQLNGRVIAEPKIILGKDGVATPRDGDFSRELLKSSVLQPISVDNWLLICASTDDALAQRVVQNYSTVARPLGIIYRGDPRIIRIQSRGRIGPPDFRNALVTNIVPGVTQFVVVIIPSNRDDLYRVIKLICNQEIPIASQVIRAQTLGKEGKVRSVMQKVALQINCKLGGALWTINIPLPERIMFLGMDVYHDPRRKNPSVTAVVATINLTYTKYYTRVIFQAPSQENISSLRPILIEALQTFYEETRAWPDRIIMFRDGVGDGQLELTRLHEVTQMLSAFRDLRIEPQPKFTFVVVQKRINARMFLNSGSHVDNARPGTVLDHTVTRRYLFDFFLVSQLIREGTVNPTHYIVLHDDSSPPIEANTIQRIAYATSYMYYNWSGSIRVPAMCQYAHKAAGLVGALGIEPDTRMNDKLYYL